MQRVLIVKFGAIGDVAMAIPAVHALYLQGACIDWVCGPAIEPLLACYPWIRTIVADDKAILTATMPKRALAIAALWKQISLKQYDLCATLYYDARYRTLTLPVRATRKLMLSRSDRDRYLLPTRHHSDEMARILLQQDDTCRTESLAPIPPEQLPACTLPPKQTSVRVALVPGGASNMLRQQVLRRWPVESYVQLAKELLLFGYEVVLVGGPDDVWVRPGFVGMNVIDAIGAMDLPEVISCFNTCNVVVSHDTGPMHLAGLSMASLVGLFGPTDPGSFLPRRPGVRGIWGGEGFACRPCYDGQNFPPCQNNGCMQQITPAMVHAQIKALLEDEAAGRVGSYQVTMPSYFERR